MEKGKKGKKSQQEKHDSEETAKGGKKSSEEFIEKRSVPAKKHEKKLKVQDDSDEDVSDRKSAFSMLQIEDDDDNENNDNEDDEEEVNKAEIVNNKGKKKKPAKKTADNKKQKKEEADIEEILAELAVSDKNKADKKKGKKGKVEEEVEEKTEEKKEEKKMEITSDMTQEEISRLMDEMYEDDDEPKKGKKKANKKGEKKAEKSVEKLENGVEEIDEVQDDEKSVNQKKKEKKERQKAEKQKGPAAQAKPETKPQETPANKETAAKPESAKPESAKPESAKPESAKPESAKPEAAKQEAAKPEAAKPESAKPESAKPEAAKQEAAKPEVAKPEADKPEAAKEPEKIPENGEVKGEEETKKSKKDRDKKKKKGGEEEKKKDEKEEKKPSKMVKEILERQKLIKAEEERLKREEEEKIRIAEEAERMRLEKERLEKERKERKKQKEKEKIERLKKEGKFLTEKQKEDRKRALQMLEAIKAQGVEVPQVGGTAAEKPKRVVYGKKKKNPNSQQAEETETTPTEVPEEIDLMDTVAPSEDTVPPEAEEAKPAEEEKDEDVKDTWDKSSDEEEEEEENEPSKPEESTVSPAKPAAAAEVKKEEAEEADSEEESSEEDSESEEDSSEEDESKTPHERAREKALARIQKRKDDAEAAKTSDILRAPVVCVLGHVDTGKTKILDKLRRTNVQDGEAGGITQQIGATNVPHEAIKEQTKMCKEFVKQELKLPGLLIIDTPGHESFSNLRSRGSSLCDIAILVVDIMHGLEPQTLESIALLKERKTPFIVALNKIDRLFGWQTNPHSDIANTLKKQKANTKMEFEERTKSIIVQFAEQSLNATLFFENKNQREYVSLVPTSAHTGDGMGNLIALICELTQSMLTKRIMYSEELKATVMEVKAIPGHGTTIDVILVNGKLQIGNTIIVAGQEGPIVTQIRSLLMPQPMHELRVKSQFEQHKEVLAAQGCKIAAKDLEKAMAGLPLYVAHQPDEIEIYKEELSQMLKDVLGDVKVSDKGVFVQASTLGSLEALLTFLKTSEIPFAGINIGPVHRRDIMKASVMLEHDPQFACILAFDVKVERDAQEMADSIGVRIFTADIIYHLFDKFMAYRDGYKKQKQEEFKHIAVFPCKLRILPQHIFNSRDPIVVGIVIEAGFLKAGTMLCVPSKEFLDVGRVSSMEVNNKPVEKATKGQEVCIKIDPIPGEAPKMYGRHFDHTDLLVSKISRQSIDAVKSWFREEMSKGDWQLVMELKKTFEIL